VLVTNILNINKLKEYIDGGYISVRHHPTLPLRIFNYTPSAMFDQFWPHEVCQCRGLILDANDVVVGRSQYKFFNLGQTSTVMFPVNRKSGTIIDGIHEDVMVDTEYLADEVFRWASELTITRKMDGQMGILWNYGDQWGIATRGSFESDGAKFATEKFQKFVKYGAAKDFIPQGWTLIFEIIAKHLRIVIPYEWEGLCLLTAVNNETGEEMSYERLHELWTNLNSYSKTLDADGVSQPGKPWCRIVEKFDIDLATANADQSLEEEGYVVAVNRTGLPPVKVKIKLEEYKRLHRILTGVTPQMIWGEMANPMNIWLEGGSKYDRKTGEVAFNMRVPPTFADWVLQWQRGITRSFHDYLLSALKAKETLHVHETTGGILKHDMERKKWLRNFNVGTLPENEGGQKTGHFPSEVIDAAMFLRSGRIVEAYDVLWKLVRPHGRDDRFYVEGTGE
jgi:RNA ligase